MGDERGRTRGGEYTISSKEQTGLSHILTSARCFASEGDGALRVLYWDSYVVKMSLLHR